uniref:DUF155 domain-containing protein n=1 Tax=Plectus sambesii TaxID=2011161 RepID=A0A914WFL5_9BILA
MFVNLDDTERAQILERLKPYETGPYPQQLVEEETEKMSFQLVESKSGIKGDTIQLNASMYEQEGHQSNKAISERFALSHGMALSVKIGIWESQLDTVAEPLLALAKDLSSGVVRVNQNDVLVKCGELHTLRQTINLDCQLTSPDYYWDRPDLELLYKESLRHFETNRRLAMINKKIDYCEEMMHLLDGVLSHRHSAKLEWIIIILIVFEVVFGCIHLADRQQWISFPISFSPADSKKLTESRD